MGKILATKDCQESVNDRTMIAGKATLPQVTFHSQGKTDCKMSNNQSMASLSGRPG
jgi:hypothetical protein